MSMEAVTVNEPEPEYGFTYCPNCDFKKPDDVVVCWKCGEHQAD